MTPTRFWRYTACGLVRITRSELDAWAARVEKIRMRKRVIQATVFDSSDGVRILSRLATTARSRQVRRMERSGFLPWDGVKRYRSA